MTPGSMNIAIIGGNVPPGDQIVEHDRHADVVARIAAAVEEDHERESAALGSYWAGTYI